MLVQRLTVRALPKRRRQLRATPVRQAAQLAPGAGLLRRCSQGGCSPPLQEWPQPVPQATPQLRAGRAAMRWLSAQVLGQRWARQGALQG
jgi:hypothetical protein